MNEENKKTKLLPRLGWAALTSPINTLLAIGLAYFAAKVYLFDGDFTDKLAMFVIIGLWIFWFIAKHMLLLFILLALAASGVYWHYTHWQQVQAECEQNGGYWNSKTKTCEENQSFWQQIQHKWQDYKSKTEWLNKLSK